MQKFNPSVFSQLQPFSKSLELSPFHDGLNKRINSVGEEDQQSNMRVKSLYNLTNEVATKTQNDAQSTIFKPQNVSNSSLPNDKNNNKNSGSLREKVDVQFSSTMNSTSEKIIHLNAKSGVSLKCAYCEAREDFKTR